MFGFLVNWNHFSSKLTTITLAFALVTLQRSKFSCNLMWLVVGGSWLAIFFFSLQRKLNKEKGEHLFRIRVGRHVAYHTLKIKQTLKYKPLKADERCEALLMLLAAWLAFEHSKECICSLGGMGGRRFAQPSCDCQ